MAKESNPNPARYGDIVERLESVVGELEGGKLSLEESLDKFAEGVKLVEAGEEVLRKAEKRIEQLLSKDGRTAPLDQPPAQGKEPASKKGAASVRPAPAPEFPDDDIPF